MKLKNYKIFSESKSQFSIYDFFDFLRNCYGSTFTIEESVLADHVEHFIGSGQWNIINSHFNKIFDVLNTVDIEYTNDRLKDLFDEYPYHDMSYAVRCVAHGDIQNIGNDIQHRYNGLSTVTNTDNLTKLKSICFFLRDLLNDTLFIEKGFGSSRDHLRTTPDEIFVTDDWFSLKNFKSHKYAYEYSVNDSWVRSRHDRLKKNFSIENYLSMRVPAIYIQIDSKQYMGNKISQNTIIKQFEEVLPSITHDLDVEAVVYSRQKSAEDVELYEFDAKIILKL